MIKQMSTVQVKRLRAIYTIHSDFYLPLWMKEESIEDMVVENNILFVFLKNGEKYSIQSSTSASDSDFSIPDVIEEDEVEVNAEDYCEEEAILEQ